MKIKELSDIMYHIWDILQQKHIPYENNPEKEASHLVFDTFLQAFHCESGKETYMELKKKLRYSGKFRGNKYDKIRLRKLVEKNV